MVQTTTTVEAYEIYGIQKCDELITAGKPKEKRWSL
jgi:hypothetical protein